MNDEFFEWLNKCPVKWVLNRTDEGTREYIFYDNEEENEQCEFTAEL